MLASGSYTSNNATVKVTGDGQQRHADDVDDAVRQQADERHHVCHHRADDAAPLAFALSDGYGDRDAAPDDCYDELRARQRRYGGFQRPGRDHDV